MPSGKTKKAPEQPSVYRAVVDLALRQAPEPDPAIKDPADDPYNQWFEWPAGTEFEPPPHMNIEKLLERGVIVDPSADPEEEIDG